MHPVVQWTFGDKPMLRECSPPRKRIRNRLSERRGLHREARYSVLRLDKNDSDGVPRRTQFRSPWTIGNECTVVCYFFQLW